MKETKRLIGKTKNGKDVFAINADSHMAAHAAVTDEMMAEAIKLIDYQAPFQMVTVDLGRIIGTDNCVETTDSDDVKMMYRKGRDGKTPIVFGREAEETTSLTVGICTDEDSLETIFTAFTGKIAPKEPWDPRINPEEKAESENFWKHHALVYDESAIDTERN